MTMEKMGRKNETLKRVNSGLSLTINHHSKLEDDGRTDVVGRGEEHDMQTKRFPETWQMPLSSPKIQ